VSGYSWKDQRDPYILK